MYRSRRKTKSRDEENSSRKLEPSRESRRTRQSYEPSPSRGSRSRTFDPSPSSDYTTSRTYEPLARSSRARTYEPSPNRTTQSFAFGSACNLTTAGENFKSNDKEFQASPLRKSFRSRRIKESPAKENERVNRFLRGDEESSRNDLSRSSLRSCNVYDDTQIRDTARASFRYPKFDSSPVWERIRFREQDPSPVRDRRSENFSSRRARSTASPKPSRAGRGIFDIDSSFEIRDGFDSCDLYAPTSQRMDVKATGYGRSPFRQLLTPVRPTQSYRVSCTSRDDDNDMHYLTMVREILLGDPIKGNTEHPAKILPHMYIGNQANAESLRLLRKIGITHVLNCAGYKGPRKHPNANPYEGLDIEYLEFKADDRDGYDMSQHFDDAFRYLDSVKRHGGICLVHCALGVNRSGLTVAAYLMLHNKWPLLKAVDFVKKRRGVVLSNHGFQRLLIRFARQQNLLDPLHERYHNLREDNPEEERIFLRSVQQAKYGHWGDALVELKRKPKEDLSGEPLRSKLGTDPGSALMYRYARFMNRDKV